MISIFSLRTNLIIVYPKDTTPKESTQIPFQIKTGIQWDVYCYDMETTLSYEPSEKILIWAIHLQQIPIWR